MLGSVQGKLGNAYSNLGDFDRALECYKTGLRISEELGNPQGVSFALTNMGIVYFYLGEYDRALECYAADLRISEELGDRVGMAITQGNIGKLHADRGEYDRALESFRQAEAEHRAAGFRYGLTYWLAGRARVLLQLAVAGGVMPEYLPHFVPDAEHGTWSVLSLRMAREQATECVAISEELEKPDTLFQAHILLARITAAEGDVAAAHQKLEQLLADAAPVPDYTSEEGNREHRAELHYWLWKLGDQGGTPVARSGAGSLQDTQEHRAEALRLYQSIIEKTPQIDYRRRIDELTTAGTPESDHVAAE
jgi:tetratricopeptide (TPR) repeat protein